MAVYPGTERDAMDDGQRQSRPIDRGDDTSPVKSQLLGARSLPGNPDQVLTARMFVKAAAGDHLCRKDDLALLASELVTNSVRHQHRSSGGQITIVVWRRGHLIRVEVIDDGADTEPVIKLDPFGTADPLAPGGRGLYLVDKIADCWGSHTDEGDRVTWFELADASHRPRHSDAALRGADHRKTGSQVGSVPP